MRIFNSAISIVVVHIFFSFSAYSQFQYLSPKPGSLYRNPETNIIIRNGDFIDAASMDPQLVHIEGSESGVHISKLALSDDGKTIVAQPVSPFTPGEQVKVIVYDGFRKKSGVLISGTTFNFNIRAPRTNADLQRIKDALKYARDQEYIETTGTPTEPPTESTRDLCSVIPNVITTTGNEFKGNPFYYNFHGNEAGCFAKTILTNNGDSVFAEFDNNRGISFTINKNGYLTYYSYLDSGFEMMDTMYNVVKNLYMGNGYNADEHELLIFPNGHRFMFSYDVQPNINLESVGGLDSVAVIGCVIQELDSNDLVIFEWSSWDHFLYTDAVFWIESLLPFSTIFDWVHANSLELDYDSNLLLSSRHLSEITKINLSTGEIMWRLGGDNNEFLFVNDTFINLPFSGQHDFRRVADGHYTLYNNGNNIQPTKSSAKEYLLDQDNKIATLVWSYSHPPINGQNVFAAAMGNVQRLPNGNTFINWGLIPNGYSAVPRFTEVDSMKNIVWEFNFVDTSYYICYRGYKFDWNRCPPALDSTLAITYVSSDSAVLTWEEPNFSSSYIFQYKLTTSTDWISVPGFTNSISLDNLIPNSFYDWQIQSICMDFGDSSAFTTIQQFNTLPVATTSINGDATWFNVFPIPAQDIVHINFNVNESLQLSLEIVNLLGAVVYSESLTASNGLNERTISIDGLTEGFYFMQLTGDNISARKQIVVQ
ncbi:MAG: aryl-sulfate sulfotransferase [Chitinophagales bacterium]|nr:aryl-sulfate sulfotransferase [Chitinophagales bacterium]